MDCSSDQEDEIRVALPSETVRTSEYGQQQIDFEPNRQDLQELQIPEPAACNYWLLGRQKQRAPERASANLRYRTSPSPKAPRIDPPQKEDFHLSTATDGNASLIRCRHKSASA